MDAKGMRIMGLMELRDRLVNAWSYTRPSGTALRRAVVMAGWSFMRVEENLIDVYYLGHGLYTKVAVGTSTQLAAHSADMTRRSGTCSGRSFETGLLFQRTSYSSMGRGRGV
jgi:hypothetical protein